MISLDTVEESIMELEQRDTSRMVCDALASLYIVRDHLRGYSVSPEATIAQAGSSDFLQTISGKNPEKVWLIMDELMSTVQVLHPAVYNNVLEKIRDEG